MHCYTTVLQTFCATVTNSCLRVEALLASSVYKVWSLVGGLNNESICGVAELQVPEKGS